MSRVRPSWPTSTSGRVQGGGARKHHEEGRRGLDCRITVQCAQCASSFWPPAAPRVSLDRESSRGLLLLRPAARRLCQNQRNIKDAGWGSIAARAVGAQAQPATRLPLLRRWGPKPPSTRARRAHPAWRRGDVPGFPGLFQACPCCRRLFRLFQVVTRCPKLSQAIPGFPSLAQAVTGCPRLRGRIKVIWLSMCMAPLHEQCSP